MKLTNSDALPNALRSPYQVRTYRKKPLMIEAMLVRDFSEETRQRLFRWFEINDALDNLKIERGTGRHYYWVRTLEGWLEVYPPIYVIRGVAGEFYPCAASIFEETYELVPERPRD